VRAVLLTGAGNAFCVGADLAQAADWDRAAPRETTLASGRRAVRSALLLHAMRKPTIAAINGACAGAGLALACVCDLRYAAASARFSTAFVHVALGGDFGGTWTLPRIVGAGKARELYLLGERFDADEAERIGLVTRSLPDETLLAHVVAVASRLAAFSPRALRDIKTNFDDAAHLDFAALVETELQRLTDGVRGPDVLEAAQAFLQKRPPRFDNS